MNGDVYIIVSDITDFFETQLRHHYI